jgi:polar amino acid transport system permease protein
MAGAVFLFAPWVGLVILALGYLSVFVWGWLNATRLRIDKIMLVWTVMLVSTLLLVVVVLLLYGTLSAVLARPGFQFALGDPSTIPGDYSQVTRLLISAPLLALAVWYGVLVFGLMREGVAPYYEAPGSEALAEQLMLRRRTLQARSGIFGLAVWLFILVLLYSVLRRFNLDLAFMGHWFRFIMAGAGVTFYISAFSILLAVVLALFGALGHLSKNPIANGVSSFYISLIRGTPLLVQIYIWYLGLPRLNIVLPATLAGILALGVNYGAYMSEIFRAGIQAIGKGQYEAAHALGMSSAQTFRRIVLPQAFRIVIPPIGNEFIAMMKDSALVSVMAVWELSYRAGKVGRQYFRSLETFIVAAAFYWILTVIFQFLQGKLETYMARSERR